MKIFTCLFISMALISCKAVLSRSGDSNYAFWTGNNLGKEWTQITEKAINNSTLILAEPEDINKFCPEYLVLNKTKKVQFWTYLISIMAYYESRFDSQTQYQEKFNDSSGVPVISRGLLQLSYESAQQKAYACDFTKAKDLHIANTNLKCAVNILSYWVKKDKRIAGKNKQALGGGRYWSVLRPSHSKFNKIQKGSKALKFCSL